MDYYCPGGMTHFSIELSEHDLQSFFKKILVQPDVINYDPDLICASFGVKKSDFIRCICFVGVLPAMVLPETRDDLRIT